MAHFKKGEIIEAYIGTTDGLNADEIVNKVTNGEPLSVWKKAKVTNISRATERNLYTVLVDGEEKRVFPRNMRKLPKYTIKVDVYNPSDVDRVKEIFKTFFGHPYTIKEESKEREHCFLIITSDYRFLRFSFKLDKLVCGIRNITFPEEKL
jgi:hypothetical protein